jgi:hypothetical protein
MKKRIRIFVLIGQSLCCLSTLGFSLMFVFQGGLGVFFHPQSYNYDLLWLFILAIVEAPFAVIGLLQAFKPSDKFMIWPCFVSIVFSGLMIYQTIESMQVALFFAIAMFPNLLMNVGTMVMLVLAIIKGFQEKKTLPSAPVHA